MAGVSSLAKAQIHLPPSCRIRLLHNYLTDHASLGGLGISPGTARWKRVVGIHPLHDPEFDQEWVRSLIKLKASPTLNQLDSVRDNVRPRFVTSKRAGYTDRFGARRCNVSISTERKSDCILPSSPRIRNL